MAPPFKVSADTGQITIGWAAPTDDGFSSVVGYKLYWNGGGSGNIIETEIYDTASDSIFTYQLTAPTISSGA